MDGKKRSIMRGTLAVLGTTAAVVLALFGVNANAAAADNTSAMGYEATTESGVKVFVDAPEGALPEGAELRAELVESEDDTQAVADELEKAEVSYDGFLALDVYFADADGKEVEPAEPVDVRFELPEGALPEGAEDLAVHHLAEAENGTVAEVEAVADDADTTEGTVAVQNDATVDAEFTVDGFSTFTITWSGSSTTVNVFYVDESGHEIYASGAEDLSSQNAGNWINLASYKKEIDGFSYKSTKKDSVNGSSITHVRLDRSGRRYALYTRNGNSGDGQQWSGSWSDNTRVYNIYYVYEHTAETGGLTEAETVDSAAQGVHMYMFNYDGKQFNGGEYGTENGSTKTGLATSKVDEDTGWPSLTGEFSTPKDSFQRYFGGTESAYNLSGKLNNSGREVNRLFLNKYYQQDGTFYYSSFENYATLANNSDDDFTVYDQLGTPDSGDKYFYQRGNFMPFNDLNPASVANYNLYDENGDELTEEDERVNEPLYALKGSPDYEFGMYVWANFYQPKDGKVESNDGTSSKDMVFEFTGDDDMWVYIDGVLVLDLGGIHDAQSGSINFADGTVTWTDTPTNGDAASYTNQTTIRKQFRKAGKENSSLWDKEHENTFADGSNHRIQVFYMERGRGASNLKISFNLKTIPDGQLSVTKQVENFYAHQVEDIDYTMKVETWDQEHNKWVPYAEKDYSLFEQEGGGTTDSNGQFKIKYGDTAIFEGIDVDTKVRVKEVAVSEAPVGSSISDAYDISYVVKDDAGQDIAGSETEGSTEGDTGYAEASMPAYGGIDVTVTNKATYTRPLKVVKKFSGTEGNKAPDDFEATYTLYEVGEDGDKIKPAIGSVKYSEFEDDGTYTFWLDTDKNYTVEETFGTGDNKAEAEDSKWQKVTVATNDPAAETESGQGIVSLDEDDAIEGDEVDTITLTNVYGPSDLTIKNVLKVTKTMHGHALDANMFDFTVEPKNWDNGKQDDEKIAVSAQDAAEKAGLKLEDDVYTYSNSGSAAEDAAGLARMGNQITFSAADIGKTYVYEYAEEEDVHSNDLETNDVAYDGRQFRIELAVTEVDGDLQVKMSKFKRDSESNDWGSAVETKDITTENCDCSQDAPLMTIDFENSVSKADLSITKKIEQGGMQGAPSNAQFKIQIELHDQDGELVNGTFDAAVGSETRKVEFKDGVAAVTIKADETIVIKGVPVGAACKVSEPEDQIPGGFELAWIDESVADGKADTRAANEDEWNGEIDPDGKDVTVTNRFVGYGVQIFKGELSESEDGSFVANHEKPLQGAEFELYVTNPETGEDLVMGNLTTDSDGSAVFQDVYSGKQGKLQLPAGTYFIRETKVPAGYQLLEKEIKLEIKADGSADFTILNDKGEVVASKKDAEPNESGNFTYDVANKPNPDLPSSGSSGTLLMMSTGFAAIVLAGTYLSKRFGHLWN